MTAAKKLDVTIIGSLHIGRTKNGLNLISEGSERVATISFDDEANARRLVACWNLCQKMSIEELESGKAVALKWNACVDELPDADTTVMTFAPRSNEPVWPGYLDNEGDKDVWLDTGGHIMATGEVTHWMDFPVGP